MSTAKKIIVLVMNIENTKFQFTERKFKVQSAVNIIAGNANVPTNVPIPLASFADNNLNLQKKLRYDSDSTHFTF